MALQPRLSTALSAQYQVGTRLNAIVLQQSFALELPFGNSLCILYTAIIYIYMYHITVHHTKVSHDNTEC